MDLTPAACLARYLEIETLLNEFYTYFDYCAAVCVPKLLAASGGAPIAACCKDRYYKVYDLDHPAFDLLRSGREALFGTPEEQQNSSSISICEYHTDTGCVLRTHKSPICLSFMCRPSIESMRERYGIYTYDYLGFNYGLEWILTGDMPETDWLAFRKGCIEMLETVKKQPVTS